MRYFISLLLLLVSANASALTLTQMVLTDIPILFGLFIGSFGLGLALGMIFLYFKKAIGIL